MRYLRRKKLQLGPVLESGFASVFPSLIYILMLMLSKKLLIMHSRKENRPWYRCELLLAVEWLYKPFCLSLCKANQRL